MLSDICICATRETSASVQLLNVALNFVFTPSKATFILWAVPDPTEVKLIPVPAAAFDAELANLNEFASFIITKYTVASVNPPIADPVPSVYVTLCPCTNL